MTMAVKFLQGSDNIIQGLGIPFGGPNNGKDLEGEFFTKSTDFALDWFTERPLLYHHGLDGSLKTIPVGKVTSHYTDNLGVWVKAELDKSNAYFAAIKKLVDEGKLFFSSGAMSHLVKIKKTGEIIKWPWVEQSLTPVPANPFATVTATTAEKHFKAVGLDFAYKANAPTDDDPNAKADPKAPTTNNDKGTETDEDEPQGAIDLNGSYEVLIASLNAAVNPSSDTASAGQAAAAPNNDGTAGANEQSGNPGDSADPNAQAPSQGDQQSGAANVVIATFPGFCIVKENAVESGAEGSLWKVDYSVDDAGTVTLGDATPVDPDDLSSGDPEQEAPPTSSAEVIAKFARTFIERTKGLSERRKMQGRDLSAANQRAVAKTAKSLHDAASTLETLLTSVSSTVKTEQADRMLLSLDLLKLKGSLE